MKNTKNVNNKTAQIKAIIEKSAPKVTELKYGEGDKELTVKVYPVLPFMKRTEMVREIVDGVFMDEKNTVNTYVPEFLTLLQKYTVIKYFTDLQLPTKLDDMWLVLNYTSIYEDVIKIVGKFEVKDIFDAANKAIDTYRQYLVSKTDMNSFMDKIGGVLKDFEGRIPQEDITAITSKIKDMPQGASLQDIIGGLLGKKDVQG